MLLYYILAHTSNMSNVVNITRFVKEIERKRVGLSTRPDGWEDFFVFVDTDVLKSQFSAEYVLCNWRSILIDRFVPTKNVTLSLSAGTELCFDITNAGLNFYAYGAQGLYMMKHIPVNVYKDVYDWLVLMSKVHQTAQRQHSKDLVASVSPRTSERLRNKTKPNYRV